MMRTAAMERARAVMQRAKVNVVRLDRRGNVAVGAD